TFAVTEPMQPGLFLSRRPRPDGLRAVGVLLHPTSTLAATGFQPGLCVISAPTTRGRGWQPLCFRFVMRFEAHAFGRPGSDLLSRVLRQSTIGAGAFHGRVRNGNGCSHPAITTRAAKRMFSNQEAGMVNGEW